MTIRPLIFVDLDDTLFQSARKMAEDMPREVVTTDSHGVPNGYMTPNQSVFTSWLLDHGDVVPVTARSVDAFRRVQMPFQLGAICHHGGVLLDAGGRVDVDWQLQCRLDLAQYQDALARVFEELLIIRQELQISLRLTQQETPGQVQFVMAKQSGGSDEVLIKVLGMIQERLPLNGLYVHLNGNNLTFIPHAISKRRAVEEWLRRDRACHGLRPVIGFGDSLTDHGFLSECDWWGTPKNGQLANWINESLS
ncbi:MAG: trehalose phosphatase [Halomonadaceae bacterium]|nr:trehalose phosphatase [Halomonadaceae bacterium]